jgi:hypothetical protein
LTTKGSRKECQAKSDCFAKFSRRKHQIPRPATAAATLRSIKIPIGATEIVAWRVAEGASEAVNGLGRTLKFEKDADWSFVEVYGKPWEMEGRAILFISECGPESKGPEESRPAARILQRKFTFEFYFVARGSRGRDWHLGGEERARSASSDEAGRRGRLDTNAKEAAKAVESRVGSVVNGVLLEDAAIAGGAKAAEALEQIREIGDSQFDFDFVMSEVWHKRKSV